MASNWVALSNIMPENPMSQFRQHQFSIGTCDEYSVVAGLCDAVVPGADRNIHRWRDQGNAT